MSKSREQLNEYLKKIDIQGKYVFDIGIQDKPTSRLTKGMPANYITMDIDRQWNPRVVGDLNEAWTNWLITWQDDKPLKYMENWADIIFCIEVLEHTWNPVKAVTNMFEILKPDGVLYLSTPFINPHHDVVDYLRYTNEWFRDVLPKLGFKQVEIFERVATVGKPFLENFYRTEGLKISKIRPEYGRYTYPIGYFVKATK